jgi:hypothetical protein
MIVHSRARTSLPCLLLVSAVVLSSQVVSAQPAARRASKTSAGGIAPVPGAVVNGVYQNPWFGFNYKLPAGWVERTEQMHDDSTDGAKARVLLAVFERPPEVSGEGVNSGVVIAAESTSLYPGLKSAVDYFGPLTEVVSSKGFKVTNEPYEVAVQTRKLVRGDFQKQLPSLAVCQSSLVEIARGFVISFTFVGQTEDEIDGLIENLGFVTAGAVKGSSSK